MLKIRKKIFNFNYAKNLVRSKFFYISEFFQKLDIEESDVNVIEIVSKTLNVFYVELDGVSRAKP